VGLEIRETRLPEVWRRTHGDTPVPIIADVATVERLACGNEILELHIGGATEPAVFSGLSWAAIQMPHTATSQLIYTEFLIEKQGDALHGTKLPDGWKE
jgi:hypothetical protein